MLSLPGKGGTKIREFQEESGARIKVKFSFFDIPKSYCTSISAMFTELQCMFMMSIGHVEFR